MPHFWYLEELDAAAAQNKNKHHHHQHNDDEGAALVQQIPNPRNKCDPRSRTSKDGRRRRRRSTMQHISSSTSTSTSTSTRRRTKAQTSQMVGINRQRQEICMKQPQTTTTSITTRQRNAVRFDLNDVVHVVQGRYQFTLEEAKKKWYTRTDFAKSRDRNNRLVAQQNQFNSRNSKKEKVQQLLLPAEGDCLRGLEHRLRGFNQRRRKTVKTNAMTAVLAEQTRQRQPQMKWRLEITMDETEQIRTVYQEYNQISVQDALQRGLIDQREVVNQCELLTRRNAALISNLQEVLHVLSKYELETGSSQTRPPITPPTTATATTRTTTKEEEEEEPSLDELVAFGTVNTAAAASSEEAGNGNSSSSSSLFLADAGASFGEDYLNDFHDSILLLGEDEDYEEHYEEDADADAGGLGGEKKQEQEKSVRRGRRKPKRLTKKDDEKKSLQELLQVAHRVSRRSSM